MLLPCTLLIVTLSPICQGLTTKLSPETDFQELEKEFSEDTDSCVEAARLKHKNNPNAGLDHFLNCLLKHVNTVSKSDLLTNIREINMFSTVAGEGRKQGNR